MATEELAWEPIRQATEIASDRDMDALHILPLSSVPVESPSLQQLKLIKNYQLESVVEVFNMRRNASLQVTVESLGKVFGWSEDEAHPDLTLIRRIGELPSFDVFSLRHLLRELGHEVNDHANLSLSEHKTAELSEYMIAFTRPLISRIYGGEDVEINKPGDLIGLFQDPDRAKVLRRLDLMAGELGIRVDEVPGFLEDYGDILLSLAFYKKCLDEVAPIVTEFLGTMDTVRSNEMLHKDEDLMRICTGVEGEVNELTATIAQRFQDLDQISRDIWDDPTAQGFKDIEMTIKQHHTSIAGVLCGLTVKMEIWEKMFPDKERSSPAQLADFIKYQMKQGLETMQEVQLTAIEWQ
jgi:hypothetical protein